VSLPSDFVSCLEGNLCVHCISVGERNDSMNHLDDIDGGSNVLVLSVCRPMSKDSLW